VRRVRQPPEPLDRARQSPSSATSTSLSELAWLFLRLGTTAFGGPVAHIAMMRDEVVIVDVPTLLLAIFSAVLVIRFKVNATWIVLGGAAAGWALGALGFGG
jgi:chromate transport protein ChrA